MAASLVLDDRACHYPQPRGGRDGMSDGTKTQIISGISEGATVITGIQEAISDEDGPEAQEGKEESPFGPKRPDKDRKKNGNGNTGKA